MLSLQNGSRSKGLYEILTKQAEGYKEVVSSWWRPTKAFQLLLIENYQNWLKPSRSG
jgi:flotillin